MNSTIIFIPSMRLENGNNGNNGNRALFQNSIVLENKHYKHYIYWKREVISEMEISNYQFLSLLHLNNMKMNRGTIIISKDSNF